MVVVEEVVEVEVEDQRLRVCGDSRLQDEGEEEEE